MIAQVIVDVQNSQVDKIFDYIIPNNLTIAKGAMVVVPFGNRKIEGFVIDIVPESNLENEKLKEIISVSKDIELSEELISLCHYLKNTFYLKMIDCIRLCLPTVVRKGNVKPLVQVNYYLNPNDQIVAEFLKTVRKNATNQLAAIEWLKVNALVNKSILNEKFGNATIKKLVENNVLLEKSERVLRKPLGSNLNSSATKKIVPTEMQQKVINEIKQSNGQTVVLHGVTGSGKTEVYLQVIESALQNGKTAIMLVPEISLTPQMTKRFTERFDTNVAVLHSGLSDGEKFDEWSRLYSGEAKVVVGARSAIFAPLKNLGVIIIDEEHDNSYVSETNPRYITSDIAKFRAEFNNCPLILGSATPNIETYYKAKTGEYKLLELPVRVNDAQMPPFTIVDMLPEFRSGNTGPLSSVLLGELNEVVKNEKQAMLFINRRGFSSFLMCRECSYIPQCEHCDISLTFHKHDNLLKCHYCGKKYKVITTCPKCNSKEIKLGGTGTQKVVEELKELFPNVKILRMDNDTTTTKDSHHKILSEFEKSKPAILVGTQMIAKGHDFEDVILVGILEADLSLFFDAYRASEKTFQLITQVAGRAGRGKHTGKVILQTYFPKHYVYKLSANYNYQAFYEKEINLREVTQFPPFTTFLRVLVTSEKDEVAKLSTHELFMQLKDLKSTYLREFIFLEAMRSPVGKIKDKYRYQIVARFQNNAQILSEIHKICDRIKNKDITIFIETNPLTLS